MHFVILPCIDTVANIPFGAETEPQMFEIRPSRALDSDSCKHTNFRNFMRSPCTRVNLLLVH